VRSSRAGCRTGKLPVLFAFFLTCIASVPASAQFTTRSWLPWRTIETAHFALHYPPELEAWTRNMALRIEAVGAAVVSEVGYGPRAKTNVIVDDPNEIANGSAWPYLNGPVIDLWATPPGPRDDIGEFRDWGTTLISHEFAHVAHLSRPSRNPLVRRLWQALPVDLGPIALKAPRWVIEGYATYVEGRVTGSGRPHGVWRPAFLREWALEGQLPRYDQLDGSHGYEGGEFAYLAGSAFLEWLVQRRGDSSLIDLWRRLSARQDRSFDEAFSGVFGESANTLYGYFSADLTANAVAARERFRAAGSAADTGTVVQRLRWDTGDPALSSDGQRVAIVLRSPTRRSRVVIWKTADEPDTGKVRRDSLLLRLDPADVPAKPLYPPAKHPLATLRSPGASYEDPRFLHDGRVLLWRSTPRGDGSARPDLYLWNPARRRVERLTFGASIREADPSSDGSSAVAVQCLHGWCDLVTVGLQTGDVRTLIAGGPALSFYRPRMKPNTTTAVVSVHDSTRWRVATVDTKTGELAYVPTPDRANHYDAAWASPTEIVDVSEASGVPNLETLDVRTSQRRWLTNVTGAAVAPTPSYVDGSVWFLSLYAGGYDLRRVTPGAGGDRAAAPAFLELAPATQRTPEQMADPATNAVSAPRPFGLGPRLFRWIPEPHLDADGAGAALGFVSADVIGRSELLATVAFGDPATWRGAAVGVTWRGMRPAFRAELFDAVQALSASRSRVPVGIDLDQRLVGGELAFDGSQQFDTWGGRYRAGASVMSANRRMIFGDLGAGWVQHADASSTTETLSGVFAAGQSFDQRFFRGVATAGLFSAGTTAMPIGLSMTYGRTNRDAGPFERFALGGGPSTLIDGALLSQRLSMPVLPAGVSTGSAVLAYRAVATSQPMSLYWWAGSTTNGAERFAMWNRVIGVEWSQSVPAIPAAGTPPARAQLGIGESLDAPFRRRVRAYMTLILSP
jgi:hypothetical protein